MSMTSEPQAEGRRPLSQDRIVDRALALANRDGLAAVSMRRLARELGVQPMSLYYHVPSRAVLMVLMASRSVAALPHPDPASPWHRRLVDLLVETYRAGVRDPAVFPVLATESLAARALPTADAATGSASLSLIGRVIAMLGEGGVPEELRLPACRGLLGMVIGFLVGRVDGLIATDAEPAPRLRQRDQRSLPADRGGRMAGPGSPATGTGGRSAGAGSPATGAGGEPADAGAQPAAATGRADLTADLTDALEVFVRGLRASVGAGTALHSGQ